MRNHRMSAVLAAAVGLTALIIGVAPAAADHGVDIDVDGSGCSKGEIAFGIPINLQSDRSVVRTLRDGTIRATCHFKGLPERIDSQDFGTWIRPTEATRVSAGVCQLHGEGLDLVFARSATGLVTPAGTLKVECLFPPQSGD